MNPGQHQVIMRFRIPELIDPSDIDQLLSRVISGSMTIAVHKIDAPDESEASGGSCPGGPMTAVPTAGHSARSKQ